LRPPGLPPPRDGRRREAVRRARQEEAGGEAVVREGRSRRPGRDPGIAGLLVPARGVRQTRRVRAGVAAVLLPLEHDARRGTAGPRRAGKLSQPQTLGGEVERMLKHPKAAAFTENFVGQWLGLREIDATEPSFLLYPEFDPMLKVSMIREVELFFAEVLKDD